MSRLDKIRAYKANQEILKNNAKAEKEIRTQELIKSIQALKPRIDELLQTANVCAENGIELNAYRKSYYRKYQDRENGTFVTNGITH